MTDVQPRASTRAHVDRYTRDAIMACMFAKAELADDKSRLFHLVRNDLPAALLEVDGYELA